YLPRLGGIERHVSDLARAQREAGHVVDGITAGGLVDGNDRPLSHTGRTPGTFDSFSSQAIARARAAVVGGDYDVVHVHSGLATPLSFVVASAAARAALPTVVTMHSMIGGMGPLYRGADLGSRWRSWP